MKRTIKIGIALFVIATFGTLAVRAPAEQSFGTQLKKIFAPTPTPTPRKHPKKKSTAEKSPTPKPTPSPEKSPSPKKKAAESPTPTSSPSASVKKKKSSASPTPEISPTASSKKKKRKSSPTPTPSPEESASTSPSPGETPKPSATASASPKKKGAPASISTSEIEGYERYPEHIRNVIDMGLDLTKRNLDYKYGSADPASGGMDCSGFVFYVLTQNGVRDVPRDSSQQYVWLRKAGTFRAVNSRHDDTFELEELAPGDLLFWTGTYSIERDPPITHAMLYLGRKKGGQRIMVGASDGRTYEGESRYGVSVFDFKVSRIGKTEEGRLTPTFIGYGHIPGL